MEPELTDLRPRGTAANRQGWYVLLVLALAQFLGMSPWFAASAVGPQLELVWSLDAQQVGWLTTSVQLGFVAGTAVAAVLNLADVIPARTYFTVSAISAALANAALLIAPSFEVGMILRFLTGAMLAGVYPPALKMAATWFSGGRGLALGIVVGALTAGKATPHLIKALGGANLEAVVVVTSSAVLVAAILVAVLYRDGPHAFPRRPFRWSLVPSVMRDAPTRAAIGGYCGHMLELYAMWAWIPAFLAASALRSGGAPAVDFAAFLAIASGALGCVIGGSIADRIGRARWTILSMVGSGACCILAAFVFGAPWLIIVLFVSVWGFLIVADSAQFSALVTEVAPPHAVGTALTIQVSIGFALTALTIQGVALAADAVGWQWAFPVLALGPALGIAAIRPLVKKGRPDER
ncbi:MAG: MFS transporter [Dehalococcoidia bacterium]